MPKLLLVEDDAMSRDMLSRRLTRRGFQVVLAVNGQEAVSQAAAEQPDLILMDLSLPVMDGWTATRAIKGDPATAQIPVVALTAHAMKGEEAKALEAGCDAFDTKPVDLTRLLATVERLLGSRP